MSTLKELIKGEISKEVKMGFPSGSDGKEPAYNTGDPGSIPYGSGSTQCGKEVKILNIFNKTIICRCAKSLQSCPTLCDAMVCNSTSLLCPWGSPGNSTGVGYHALLQGIFFTQG